MRQVALDLETTGLYTEKGDKIIEIGCVEIINRTITGNIFHSYCNPERLVSKKATEITGIKDQFLIDKPKFIDIADQFLKFISGTELIIHNASFDLGFINYELQQAKHKVTDLNLVCPVIDTLGLARERHPGQSNTLDALAKRYSIDVDRKLHGALLDAKILANLILKMTAGQSNLDFSLEDNHKIDSNSNLSKSVVHANMVKDQSLTKNKAVKVKILYANSKEIKEHESYIQKILNLN